ncbi:MAG: hypothetical protein P4L83_12705 [Nevskia sp.]|nr:hypothetical protein [Nevskia sp.]
MVTTQQAHAFVSGADLRGLPDYHSALAVLGAPGFEPDTDKTQSVLVGSTINSFVKGVTAERRNAINDSSLFAQLVANKKVPKQSDVIAWYDAYFEALTNVGWTLQSRSFATYEAGSQDADVHEAILTVASGLLGGTASAGYALIKLTLDALKKLSDSSPWITMFSRESQHEKAARFQVSLVNQDANQDFLVSLMAFTLEASQTVEQVLFFKFKSMTATLRQFSGDVTINDRVLNHVAPLIAQKVDAFYDGYVLGVDLR